MGPADSQRWVLVVDTPPLSTVPPSRRSAGALTIQELMRLYPVHVRSSRTLALKLSALTSMSIFSSFGTQGDLSIMMGFRHRVLPYEERPLVE